MHPPNSSTPSPVAAVRVAQIITIALVSGVLTFAGIAAFLRKFDFGGEAVFLSWMGLGFAAVVVLMHVVMPGIVIRGGLASIAADDLKDLDDEAKFARLFPIFQTGHIIACALLEGGGFFNLFVFLTSGYVWNFVTAITLVVLICIRFPTLQNSQFWVEDNAREIENRGR